MMSIDCWAFILTSLVLKPTEEITKVAVGGAEISNEPLLLLLTPVEVPFIVTEALGTPCPVSVTTRPLTTIFWACAGTTKANIGKRKRIMNISFSKSSPGEVDAFGKVCVTKIFINNRVLKLTQKE
jgi:hypothetical protein